MKLTVRVQYSGPRLDGLKKEKDLQNIFFNLARRNYEKKIISQLYNGEEELLSDFKKVNNETENHFSQFHRTNFDPNKEKEI